MLPHKLESQRQFALTPTHPCAYPHTYRRFRERCVVLPMSQIVARKKYHVNLFDTNPADVSCVAVKTRNSVMDVGRRCVGNTPNWGISLTLFTKSVVRKKHYPKKESEMGELFCKTSIWWKLQGSQWQCLNLDSPLYGYRFLNHEDVADQVSCVLWDDGIREPEHEESPG